jgi:hypothetical protein
VTKIGGHAFSGCNALTDVIFKGTKEEWDKVSISKSGNDVLFSDTINFWFE